MSGPSAVASVLTSRAFRYTSALFLLLPKIGGRGSAGYTMMLVLNLKSRHVKHTHKDLPDGSTANSYVPTQTGWAPSPAVR